MAVGRFAGAILNRIELLQLTNIGGERLSGEKESKEGELWELLQLRCAIVRVENRKWKREKKKAKGNTKGKENRIRR